MVDVFFWDVVYIHNVDDKLFCVIGIDCKLDWIWSRSPDEITVLGVVLPLSELCTLPSSFLVVFHIWRASWKNRISWTTMKLSKLLVKPVMRQNISSCLVLSPELVMHDAFNVILWTSTDICFVMHDDLGWRTKQLDIFCRVTGFTSDFCPPQMSADICIGHDDLGWKNRTTRCNRFWRAGCSWLDYIDIRLIS